MPTNFRDYFNTRIAQEIDRNAQQGISTKYDALQAATAQKVQALDQGIAQAKQRELAAASSLVGQWGMDPEGLAGTLTNLGASAYAGTSRLVGEVAGLVGADLEAMVRDASITEPQKQAIGRYQQGIASAEDVALINTPNKGREGAYTPLDQAIKARAARARSGDINDAFDQSSLVHQGRRDALHSQLGENFQGAWDQVTGGAESLRTGEGDGRASGAGDLVTGLARLVYNAGEAAVNNLGAASEYVVENLPQLAVGALGAGGRAAMLASNAGYASEAYQKGVAKYQNENKGAYPPPELRQSMAMHAASMALAEQVGDTSLLKGMRVAKDAADKAIRTGFKQAILNTAKAVGAGAATEAATEGWQTYAEGQATLEPASAQDIYEGAAIGGMVGGGLRGGGRGAAEALKVTPEHAQKAAQEHASVKAKKEVQEAAIATGDVSALVDPKKPTYDAAKAVSALAGNSALPEATEEVKQANLVKATEIVSELETNHRRLSENYALTTPEGLAKEEAALAEAKTAGNTELAVALQESIEAAQATTPKQARSLKVQVARLDEMLTQARENLARFTSEVASPAGTDVDALVTSINAPVDTADAGAVATRAKQIDTVINLSMASPGRLTPQVATALAEATDNGLTEGQRTYLREFSAARIAENTAKGLDTVQQEIFVGGKGYVGLVDHRSRIAPAIAAGNQKQADRHLNVLRAFQKDHLAKAEIAEAAWEGGAGKGLQIVRREGNGAWEINVGQRMSDKAIKRNGGLTLNTEKLPVAIRAEATAITAALKELEAAHALKFKVAPKPTVATGVDSNVKDVPRSHDTAQDTGRNDQEAQAEGAAAASKDAGPAAAPIVGDGSPALESTGVTQVRTAEDVVQGPLQSTESISQEDTSSQIKEPTESPEGTSATEVEVSEAESAPGGLRIFEEVSKEQVPTGTKLGSVYRSINKAVAFLTQKLTKVKDDADIPGVKPLADVRDFLAQWNKGLVEPSAFFVNDELGTGDPDGHRAHALATFQKFATQWSTSIRKNFIKGSLPNSKGNTKNADQLFRDPVQDFFNEDGTMDENVVTAVAYGAYSGLVDAMNAPALKAKDDILEMHGMDPEAGTVTPAGQKALKWMSTFEDTMANSLGEIIVSALGLKPNTDAPQDYMPKLRAAFGVHALKLLEREGLIKIERINQQLVNEYLGQEPGSKTEVYNSYVRIVRDRETLKPVGNGQVIQESSVGAGDIVNKMFKVERAPTEASTSPVKYVQEFAKGTSQEITKKQRKILAAANKQEHRVIPAMWSAMQVLGEDVILKAAGWIEYQEDRIQASNRENVLAQNENLRNQLDGMVGLVQSVADITQPFFVNYEAWRNFRVGITTRNLNPQSSKIHRFMFFRPEWEATIPLDDQAKVDQFLVSIAQAFGEKIDKRPNAEMLAEFNEKLADPGNRTVELAVLLHKSSKDPANNLLTPKDKVDIADLASGAEGMQTLQALVAYGEYLAALTEGKPDFTVQMMVGVDGKTNGPILSHLALGAAGSIDEMFGLMNRGGMYRVTDGVRNFNHWYKRATSLDLYEDLARAILESLGAKNTPEMAALYTITKPLLEKGKVTGAGRNLVKTPLTSFAFGSSIKKSIENMQAAFVQSVADRIQDVASGDSKTTREELISSINTLLSIGSARVKLIPESATIEQLMEWEIDTNEAAAFKQAFQTLMGKAVLDTMGTYFEVFNQRRNSVNHAIQAGFSVYTAIYQDLRAKEIDRLIAAGEIATATDGTTPLHDLTVGQEDALRKQVEKVLPRAHTAYSQAEDNLAAGLTMAKTDTALSQDPMHKVEAQMGIPFKGNKGQDSIQALVQATIRSEVSPGVAGLPYFMHALDSYIMHLSIEGTETLNVHDEAGNGVDKVERTAQKINGSTWKGMLEFSPAKEAFEMFERSIVNAAAMQKEGTLSASAQAQIQALAEKLLERSKTPVPAEGAIFGALQLAKDQQFAADEMRLMTMAEMAFVDQYTWEGGEYEVTKDDRGDAVKRLEALRKVGNGLSAETSAAAQALNQSTKEEVPVTAPVELEGDPVPKTSPFGVPGKPATVDAGLVDFFKLDPNPGLKGVLFQLYKSIKAKGEGRTNAFQLELLKQLSKVVDGSIKVKLITAESVEADVLEVPKQSSLGWFVSKQGKAEVYILSSDFVNSGLQTTETLLHELTHAALTNIVAREQFIQKNNPGYSNPSLELINELEALQQKAKAYAKEQGITQFDSAQVFTDLHEFIAWGMTNTAFQRDVLNQVTMKTKTSRNVLVSGFKAFIDTLVGILFKGSDKSAQARTVNGMAIMVKNVSGLLNQAQVERGRFTGTVNQSQAVRNFTTLEVQAALNGDGLTTAFDARLSNLLGRIVDRLHGPFGAFKNDVLQRTSAAVTPEDVWLKAKETGLAPLELSVRGSPILASQKELHAMEQVEATVRAALARNEVTTRAAYKELRNLYTEMKAKIKPSDFADQAEYDFIFKEEVGADGLSHHLARFAAFALAHQEFNRLMQVATDATGRQVKDAKSFSERAQIIFEKILSFFAEALTKTYGGQQADQKLETLVTQLVEIEAKKRLAIERAAAATGTTPIELADQLATDAGEQIKAGILKVANTPFVKNSSNTFVKLGGAMARLHANDQVEHFLRTVGDFRDKTLPGLHGVPMELVNQLRGMGQTLNLLQLMSTNVQRHRKHIITETTKAALGAFSKTWTKRDKTLKGAISQVFMRTGMHSLLGRFNMLEIEKLLTDPKDLQKAIADTESLLGGVEGVSAYRDQYMHQANALAYFRTTGRVKHERLMMNAHNIARLYGTTHAGRVTEAQAKAVEPILEQLVALYALEYTTGAALGHARQILRTELDRPDGGNGVEFVLRLHQKLEQESKDRLFRNQEALMMHGHTPEIVNPGTVVAIADEVDGKELEYLGYTKMGSVPVDPADPNQDARFMYVLRDGGLARFQTGIVGYTNMRAKGSTKHSGYLNVNTAEGLENSSTNADIAASKPSGLARGRRPDLSKVGGTFMAPVVNPQGTIVNWRYLMNDQTKDSILERDNRFENILGVLAGSIYDKQSTTEANTKTFEALRDIYQAQRHTEAESFVLVGPNSPDARLREIWAMLPEPTRAQARSMFSQDGLYVRKDQLLPVFGFRQYSLAQAFKDDPAARNILEKVLVDTVEWALALHARTGARVQGKPISVGESKKRAKKAAVLFARGEKAWQELVHEVKDIIVIKSIDVMLGNIYSNFSLLILQGVPLRDMLRHHLVALRAARSYEEDSAALTQLEIKVSTGTAPADVAQEMARLKDALARNPVMELIEGGLMPTIVEDVAADDELDAYSYKSQLARKVEKYTDKLNPTVVKVAKNIYMGHDTKPYQILNRATRMSDFTARYALYQHLTTRKKNPLDKDAAIHEASETFVNYDSPLPRGIQYLDGMGIMPFTKYYLRIQRVLMKLVKDNPGRVLATLLLNNFVSLGLIVLDSAWVTRIGNNPLQWGALQLPGQLDEIGTIAAATALVK